MKHDAWPTQSTPVAAMELSERLSKKVGPDTNLLRVDPAAWVRESERLSATLGPALLQAVQDHRRRGGAPAKPLFLAAGGSAEGQAGKFVSMGTGSVNA